MKLVWLFLSLSLCRVLWKLIPFFCLSVLCLTLNIASLCPVSCSNPGIAHAHFLPNSLRALSFVQACVSFSGFQSPAHAMVPRIDYHLRNLNIYHLRNFNLLVLVGVLTC
jgi:hypothetical protein